MLTVSSIQRFCLRDGPGIRTVVFLQGCPLRCWWCHNPEMRPREHPAASHWETARLVDELERDLRYWRWSRGGVTFSGGEPLAQAGGLAEVLVALGSRGHHRAVETSGAAEPEAVRLLAPLVDLWLWDVKAVDPDAFREATGGDSSLPLGNLGWLLGRTDARVVVRLALVRGFNDGGEAGRIARWLASQPRRVPVEVLEGHDLAGGKSRDARPGRSARPERGAVEAALAALREAGLEAR